MALVHDFTCPPGFEPEDNTDDPSEITADLEDENIELWMIKAPLNFDVSLLSGHELKEHFNIPLQKKSDIEFVAKATENHPMCKTLQTVFQHRRKNKLTIGPSFKGYVDIVQSVKIPSYDYPNLPQEKPHEIPSNLRQRYIPYGSHSPPRISSSVIVKEKSKKRKRSESLSLPMPDFDVSQVSLADSQEAPSKKKRKKHKKKKDADESLMSFDMADDTCLLTPSTPAQEAKSLLNGSFLPDYVGGKELDTPQIPVSEEKKKKKNRVSFHEDFLKDVQEETFKPKEAIVMNSIGDEESTPVSEKKKKKKSKKNRDEMDGSILENSQEPLLNGSLQNSLVDESLNEPLTPTTEGKKKKKKHKRESAGMDLSISINNEEPLLNGSLQNSLVEESLNEPLTPTTEGKKKKKKHKRESAGMDLSISINNEEQLSIVSSLQDTIIDGILNESVPPTSEGKKKKHKRKSGDLSLSESINEDLPIPETSQLDDHDASLTKSGKKKKKKHRREEEEEEKINSDDHNKTIPNSLDDSAAQTPNSSKKKKKKHKGDKEMGKDTLNTTATNCLDDSIVQKAETESASKKKKKRKRDEEETEINNNDHNLTANNTLNESQISNMESSSKKKKSKKRKHSDIHDDAIPLVNGFSMDTAEELMRKDSGIGSMDMESNDLNSEQLVSSSHKKKKKKHKKHSLDDTYLELNIPT